MAEALKEYLSAAEVADVLGLQPVTIYRWCRAGRLASVKIGKEWRIRRSALDELLGRSLRDELGRRDDGEESMHEVSLETHALARRLLRQDAGGSRDVPALAAALERTCAHLRERLLPLIGRTGYTVLFRRALHLAQSEFPTLSGLAVGEGADPCVTGVSEFAATYAADDTLIEDALVAVVAHLIGLLNTFIGEGLTRRVIGEQWPVRGDGTETAL